MAAKRVLTFRNDSTMRGYACLFQSHPGAADLDLATVAWVSKVVHPTTEVMFEWEETYSLMWSEVGHLVSGATFMAGQDWPAGLSIDNQATLTYDQGAFTFQNQTVGPRSGSLFISMDRTIPFGKASVGFGMAGKPICAMPAVPNVDVILTPKPHYWVTFGKYKEGQVLDLSVVTKAVEISFPDHDRAYGTITLTHDNMWKVSTSA